MRRLLAATGLLALTGAGVLAVAAPAEAAAKHVGIVVRYANGKVSAKCAKVGGSGLQLLQRTHSVTLGTMQYSGFVLKIDGTGTAHPDNTHYWSYWHSGGRGSWSYSSSGAASYSPKAGTVEGWSYVNGQSTAPKPRSYTYAALCGRLDPKPARTTAQPTHSTVPSSTAPASTQQATPRPTTSAVPRSTAAGAPHTTTVASPSRHAVPVAQHNRTTPPSATHAAQPASASRSSAAVTATTESHSSASTPAAPSTADVSVVAGSSSGSSSGGAPWGTVAAFAVIVALAGTAWFVMRRRSA
jgi:hypothetical protein